MTNHPDIQKQYEPAYEELGQVMHTEELKKLPLMWGNEYLEENETADVPVSYHVLDTNTEKLGEDYYHMTAKENYFFFALDKTIKGSQVSFLRISVQDPKSADTAFDFDGMVYFIKESESIEESHRFKFTGGEGEFLIPLSTSPYWSYSDNIQAVMLDFIGEDLPDKELEVHLEFETLK